MSNLIEKLEKIGATIIQKSSSRSSANATFKFGRKTFHVIDDIGSFSIYTASIDPCGDVQLRAGRSGKTFRTVVNFVNYYNA